MFDNEQLLERRRVSEINEVNESFYLFRKDQQWIWNSKVRPSRLSSFNLWIEDIDTSIRDWTVEKIERRLSRKEYSFEWESESTWASYS